MLRKEDNSKIRDDERTDQIVMVPSKLSICHPDASLGEMVTSKTTKNDISMPKKGSRSFFAVITSDEKLRKIAQTRWLSVKEIAFLLSEHQRVLPVHRKAPLVRPESGDIFLYDRSIAKRYKTDHHDWIRKRHNVKKVREDHVKLRMNGVARISGCYVHSSTIQSMHRRSYHLLSNEDGVPTSGARAANSLVLVHYLDLDVAAAALSSMEHSLDLSSSSPQVVSSQSSSPTSVSNSGTGRSSRSSVSRNDDHYDHLSEHRNNDGSRAPTPMAYDSFSDGGPHYYNHAYRDAQGGTRPNGSPEPPVASNRNDSSLASSRAESRYHFERGFPSDMNENNGSTVSDSPNPPHVGSTENTFNQENSQDDDPWHISWIPPFKRYSNGPEGPRRSQASKMESFFQLKRASSYDDPQNVFHETSFKSERKAMNYNHQSLPLIVNGCDWGSNEMARHNPKTSSSRQNSTFRSICWESSDIVDQETFSPIVYTESNDRRGLSSGEELYTSSVLRPIPRLNKTSSRSHQTRMCPRNSEQDRQREQDCTYEPLTYNDRTLAHCNARSPSPFSSSYREHGEEVVHGHPRKETNGEHYYADDKGCSSREASFRGEQKNQDHCRPSRQTQDFSRQSDRFNSSFVECNPQSNARSSLRVDDKYNNNSGTELNSTDMLWDELRTLENDQISLCCDSFS